MFIRCWGSRGQIPVCGKEFNKYGGDTTCIEIRSENNDVIIVDAGSGIRHIDANLYDKKEINIILTHFHLDHIIGFPFFNPLYSSYSITVYAPPYNGTSISTTLSTIIGAPYFPLELNKLNSNLNFVEIENIPFKIGSIKITPIKLNHPNGGFGFKFEEEGKSFVFLTDNELNNKNNSKAIPFYSYVEFCKDVDLLIHDAEFFTDEYNNYYHGWGHSSYLDAVELAIQSSVKQLGLFHFHHTYTDSQIDDIVEDARKIIFDRGKKINCFAVGNKFTINKL